MNAVWPAGLRATWKLAIHFAVMAIVLLGGTYWLVPGSRMKRVRPTAGTSDRWH